jgi:hypothetical protein
MELNLKIAIESGIQTRMVSRGERSVSMSINFSIEPFCTIIRRWSKLFTLDKPFVCFDWTERERIAFKSKFVNDQILNDYMIGNWIGGQISEWMSTNSTILPHRYPSWGFGAIYSQPFLFQYRLSPNCRLNFWFRCQPFEISEATFRDITFSEKVTPQSNHIGIRRRFQTETSWNSKTHIKYNDGSFDEIWPTALSSEQESSKGGGSLREGSNESIGIR